MAQQPFVLELSERRPPLLDVTIRVGPVDLVEIDRVNAEPRQAGLDLAADRVPLEAVHHAAAAAVEQPGLGEHVRAPLDALQRAAHDPLRVPEAVDSRRVDPVDTELQRPLDRGHRLGVVLRAPAELPVPAPDRPRAEPDTGDLQAGPAELGSRKRRLLHVQPLIPKLIVSFRI